MMRVRSLSRLLDVSLVEVVRNRTAAFSRRILRLLRLAPRRISGEFEGSGSYWEKRYIAGGNSGPGSYGDLATFKAKILNEFIAAENVPSVIEFGCGDGHQLSLARYPRYLGLDVSGAAIASCRTLFADDPSKAFGMMQNFKGDRADTILSLDVIYHLVEDTIFEKYMTTIFDCAQRWVVIYSSNFDGLDESLAEHVRHRKFTSWIAANRPEWYCADVIKNAFPYKGDYQTGSHADFHFFAKREEV
jgi:SAM-dependent methyltransferase